MQTEFKNLEELIAIAEGDIDFLYQEIVNTKKRIQEYRQKQRDIIYNLGK